MNLGKNFKMTKRTKNSKRKIKKGQKRIDCFNRKADENCGIYKSKW